MIEQVLIGVVRQIRTYRRRLGLSQVELAERAGLAVETISKLENAREWPSLTTVVRLTMALGISLQDLFGEVISTKVTDRHKQPAKRREERQLIEILPRLDVRAVRQLLSLARLLEAVPPRQSRRRGANTA